MHCALLQESNSQTLLQVKLSKMSVVYPILSILQSGSVLEKGLDMTKCIILIAILGSVYFLTASAPASVTIGLFTTIL